MHNTQLALHWCCNHSLHGFLQSSRAPCTKLTSPGVMTQHTFEVPMHHTPRRLRSVRQAVPWIANKEQDVDLRAACCRQGERVCIGNERSDRLIWRAACYKHASDNHKGLGCQWMGSSTHPHTCRLQAVWAALATAPSHPQPHGILLAALRGQPDLNNHRASVDHAQCNCQDQKHD